MERRAELIRVKQNVRYKMVGDTDGNYYLLDTDYNMWGYLSMVFNWIFPQKLYKVTEEQLKELEAGEYIDANHSHGNMGAVLAMIGSIFGANILQKFLARISFSVPVTGRYIIAILLVSVILMLCAGLSYSQKKKVTSFFDLSELKVVKARIVPVEITKGHRKSIYINLFLTAFFLLMPIFYIVKNDVNMLLGTVIGSISLICNAIAFSDGEYIMKFDGVEA